MVISNKKMMRQEKKTRQKNKSKERPGKSTGSPETPPQEMDIRHPQPPFRGLIHEHVSDKYLKESDEESIDNLHGDDL